MEMQKVSKYWKYSVGEACTKGKMYLKSISTLVQLKKLWFYEP